MSSIVFIRRTLLNAAFQVISTTTAQDETVSAASRPKVAIVALFLVYQSVSAFLGSSVSLATPSSRTLTVSSIFQAEVVVASTLIKAGELIAEVPYVGTSESLAVVVDADMRMFKFKLLNSPF